MPHPTHIERENDDGKKPAQKQQGTPQAEEAGTAETECLQAFGQGNAGISDRLLAASAGF